MALCGWLEWSGGMEISLILFPLWKIYQNGLDWELKSALPCGNNPHSNQLLFPYSPFYYSILISIPSDIEKKKIKEASASFVTALLIIHSPAQTIKTYPSLIRWPLGSVPSMLSLVTLMTLSLFGWLGWDLIFKYLLVTEKIYCLVGMGSFFFFHLFLYFRDLVIYFY